MSSTRTTATVAGVFFLITEVAAIAGKLLYAPVGSGDYVLGAGADNRVLLGVFFELVLVAAIIGTAVTLYPIVRRQNHGIALGYVVARLLEGAVILVGVVSVLTIVTLRQGAAGTAGTDDAALAAVGQSLVASSDWTFLLGPGVILGTNSLLLAYLMYRSGLVPRFIAVLGLIGGPLVAISAVAVMFGLYDLSTHVISAGPVFAWEVSLAVYLIARGFKSCPVTARPIRPAERLPEPSPL